MKAVVELARGPENLFSYTTQPFKKVEKTVMCVHECLRSIDAGDASEKANVR